MKVFDSHRADYEPYGLTCEIWETSLMSRFDRHNEIEINFLLDGDMKYFFQDRYVTVPALRIAIFWGLVPHKIVQYSKTTTYFVCTIPLSTFLGWELPESYTSRILQGDILIDSIDDRFSICDRMMFENWHTDLRTEEKKRMVLLEIQSRLLRMSSHEISISASAAHTIDNSSGLIERMALYIAKNYNQPIQLSDIGEAVNLHPDYANQLFKKAFGHTLNAHLIAERITQAKRLLLTTTTPIVQIAYDCGFNSISCFNRAFKLYNNCTPRDYRTILRPKT